MKIVTKCLSFGLLFYVASLASLAVAEQKLKSPFFIDGIHCEGQKQEIKKEDINFGGIYKNKNDVLRILKLTSQVDCEATFARNGVKKFQWLTQESFEQLEFDLQNSNEFLDVSISIKKSDLKNHVHLFGKFTEHKKKNFLEMEYNKSAQIEQNAGEGDRSTDSFQARYHINQKGPAGLAQYEVYAKKEISRAENSIISEDNQDLFSEETRKSLQNKDNSFGEFGVQINVPRKLWGQHQLFLNIGHTANRITGDEFPSDSGEYRLGFVFKEAKKNINSTLINKIFILRADDVSAASKNNALDAEGNEVHELDGSTNYFGWEGSLLGTQDLEIELLFYRSLDKTLRYHFDEKISYRFTRILGVGVGLKGHFVVTRDMTLPQYRFLAPRSDINSLSIFLDKSLDFAGSRHNLNFELGNSTYEIDDNTKGGDKSQKIRASSFAGINYEIKADAFSTKLGFLYGKRLN